MYHMYIYLRRQRPITNERNKNDNNNISNKTAAIKKKAQKDAIPINMNYVRFGAEFNCFSLIAVSVAKL